MSNSDAKPRSGSTSSAKAARNRGKYNFALADVRRALIQEYGESKVTNGTGYITAPCLHPDHDDENPSMSVSEGEDGRTLVHCHAGCDQAEVFDALRKFMGRNGKRDTAADVDLDPTTECTLEAYAEAKLLPVVFLREIGLRDQTLPNQGRVVRIPYSDEATRYRIALSGDNRFRWKSGSNVSLYGLFAGFRTKDYVVLVEGESCAQTLWLHDISAFGVPGASNWKGERDAPHLEPFERVYLVVEPDRAGENLREKVARSESVRDRLYLLDLGEHKDVSAFYLADPEAFEERFTGALERAEAWTDFEDRKRSLIEDAAWERCADLVEQERILDLFQEDVRRAGVVGEERSACILYLALTSRRFERPASVIVKGPSAAGKSYVVEQVLSFFPQSAFYALSAMSERALVYWDEDLIHRMLVLFEAEALNSDFLSYILRSLLSEGQVRYITVESTPDGLVPREIIRPGPTGLLLTTTQVQINPENETRMLSLTITDTPEQTKDVLLSIARGADAEIDFGRWHALQEWIGAREEADVVVPFAERLAELIPPVATRLRRDFTTLLMLVRAHALLHQRTRERDEEGRIVATVNDYAIVRDLIASVFTEALGARVSDEVVEVVEAVRELIEDGVSSRFADRDENHDENHRQRIVFEAAQGVSTSAVAQHLGLDETTAWRRVQVALKGNYLRNLETRKYTKARLVLGDAPLEEQTVLPLAEDLA